MSSFPRHRSIFLIGLCPITLALVLTMGIACQNQTCQSLPGTMAFISSHSILQESRFVFYREVSFKGETNSFLETVLKPIANDSDVGMWSISPDKTKFAYMQFSQNGTYMYFISSLNGTTLLLNTSSDDLLKRFPYIPIAPFKPTSNISGNMSKVLVTSYDVGLNQRFKQPKWLSVNIDLRTDPPLNLFAWSQDNSKLSFTAGNTLFISNLSESTTKALTQIVYAQSNVLQVTDFGSIRKILVSPDGLRIAYTDQFAHIWVIDADGKNNSYISTGILLGWSQDSNRLMVFAEGGVAASTRTVTSHNMINGEVGVLSLPNCATRLLQYPVLSPQNNRIAYVSNNRDIWVVNIDGSNAYRLEMGNWSTPNAGYTTNIFWSPDGRYVATRVVDSNDQDNIEKYHKADSVRFVAVFDTIGNSPCIAATGQWLSLRQWI